MADAGTCALAVLSCPIQSDVVITVLLLYSLGSFVLHELGTVAPIACKLTTLITQVGNFS